MCSLQSVITPGSLLQWEAQRSSKGKYTRKTLLKNPVTCKKEKGKPHHLSNPVPNQDSGSNGSAGALPSPSSAPVKDCCLAAPWEGGFVRRRPQAWGGARSQHVPSAVPRYPAADALTLSTKGWPQPVAPAHRSSDHQQKTTLRVKKQLYREPAQGPGRAPLRTHQGRRAHCPLALDTAHAVRQPVKARPVLAGSLQNVEPD